MPRILDLFCGGGGAAMGLHRAGFDVVGVDINPQPNYPFTFIQGDALEADLSGFDAIWASPPCQSYTRKVSTWGRERKNEIIHPDLVEPTRELLEETGLPYIIENVIGAPLKGALMLCGTMFGLNILKHRIFEANFDLGFPPATCNHHKDIYNPWAGEGRTAEKHRVAQGTPWLPPAGGASRAKGITGDLNNAIPPAYSEYIGNKLIEVLNDHARLPAREHRRPTPTAPRLATWRR